MDFSQFASITKQYNWRGHVEGYSSLNSVTGEHTFIPHDCGNRHFQYLTKALEEGKCLICEPSFSFYQAINGKSGVIVGYHTNLGFVPADDTNNLHSLLVNAINKGDIENRGIAEKFHVPHCTHLKFLVFFPRPWPHLAGDLASSWGYRTSSNATSVTCDIKMSNHPKTAVNPIESTLSSLGLDGSISSHFKFSLQQALLEIQFSVSDLDRLYRSERQAGFGRDSSFIEDEVEQWRIIFDCKTGTLDTRILLRIAPSFLRRAVADIANDVAQKFNREYGGHSVGFIRELGLHERFLCLLVDANTSEHHLWMAGSTTNLHFNLSGIWQAQEDELQSRSLMGNHVKSRLRTLIDAGFVPEAIVVANSYFEVFCRKLVVAIIPPDSGLTDFVTSNPKFSYGRCIEILKDIVSKMVDGNCQDKLRKWLDNLEEIYRYRNKYVHALEKMNHDFNRSVDIVREAEKLLKPILDPHDEIFIHARVRHLINVSESAGDCETILRAVDRIKAMMRQK